MKSSLTYLIAFFSNYHPVTHSFAPNQHTPTTLSSRITARSRGVRSTKSISLPQSPSGEISIENTPEYAFLLPGNTVRIQIGDVTASRKAWKKRRRNSSPILIPCSILGMNREWMVRWNVMTLLHQVGEERPSAGGAVAATAGKLGRAYRERLGGDLKDHAKALGHNSVESLLQSLFDDRIQAEYGVQTFIEPQHGNFILKTSLTRRQARSFSSSAGMVQFHPEIEQDGYSDAIAGDSQKMIHTGIAQLPLSAPANANNNSYQKPRFTQEPLGAALRVSPYDEAAERYREGEELNAFVYSYEVAGDNESPLLVLTADDPRGKGMALGGTGTSGSSTRVFKRRNMRGGNLVDDASIERELGNISVGDGPFTAKVVAVSSHSNALFVDCGVGRKQGKRYGGGVVKVLGMLRFEDIGSENHIESGDIDMQAGDEIKVYIKAVFPQSGRFMVTLDPSVKTKKPKEMKKEKEADKRKERLTSKVNEEEILSLIGNEFDGIVKAKSKTGDWYYVQPCIKGGEDGVSYLPVGVANFLESESDEESPTSHSGSARYSPGDHVRVRLEGIDEKRGQLSLTLSRNNHNREAQ